MRQKTRKDKYTYTDTVANDAARFKNQTTSDIQYRYEGRGVERDREYVRITLVRLRGGFFFLGGGGLWRCVCTMSQVRATEIYDRGQT